MAKSSSAESTPSNGKPEEIDLDLLAKLIRQPSAIDQLSEAQSSSLLLQGALFNLRRDGSPQAVEILKMGARLCPVPTIRAQALDVLLGLASSSNLAAGDALYSLAVHDGIQQASQLVHDHKVPATRTDLQAADFLLSGRSAEYQQLDPDHRLLTTFFFNESNQNLQDRLLAAASQAGFRSWVSMVAAGRDPTPERLGALHALFGSFPDSERTLALEILDHSAKTGDIASRQEICQLFVDYEYTPAKTLALSQGYAPASPAQAALFYFLSEQWQIYEYLDFNQTLLAAAYESAGIHLRQRILFLSRYAGRTEWMNSLSTTSRQRWLWDMSDADWNQAVQNLRTRAGFEDLWRLAQVAAPLWSAQILQILSNDGWQPEREEEQEGFRHLLDLVAAVQETTPPVPLLHTWRSPSQDITCLGLSQDGSYLAVGGSNSTIHLWGIYKSPSPLPPIIGPNPQSRSLAFCPNGEFLAVASGDNAIRTFRLSDGKMVKSLEGHTGLVRALSFAPDSRTLFSASFDGSVRAWRFPQGPELKRIDTGRGELFGLAASPDGQILLAGGAGQGLSVFRWPDGDPLWQLTGHTATITSLVAVPRGQLAATAGRDGRIILWNYIAGRSIQKMAGEELITALAFHPNEQFILGATAQGNISIWNGSTGKKVETISAHSHAVIGLGVSPDGHQLFSASSDGTISAWDLQLFTWARTPIGSNRSQTLTQVELRTRQSALKPVERGWLLLIAELIRWRQRFDVELDETHQVISAGEFDIEL